MRSRRVPWTISSVYFELRFAKSRIESPSSAVNNQEFPSALGLPRILITLLRFGRRGVSFFFILKSSWRRKISHEIVFGNSGKSIITLKTTLFTFSYLCTDFLFRLFRFSLPTTVSPSLCNETWLMTNRECGEIACFVFRAPLNSILADS